MKLTSAQEKLLKRGEAAKAAYNDRIRSLESLLVAKKEEEKAPVRAIAQEMFEANIPERQIHLALGYKDYRSLRNFLMEGKPGLGDFLSNTTGISGDELVVLAPSVTYKMVGDTEGVIIDVDGEEFKFMVVGNKDTFLGLDKLDEAFPFHLKAWMREVEPQWFNPANWTAQDEKAWEELDDA